MIKKMIAVGSIATLGFIAPNLEGTTNSDLIMVHEDILIESVTTSTSEVKIGNDIFDLEQGDLTIRSFQVLNTYECIYAESDDWEDESYWKKIHSQSTPTNGSYYTLSKNNINDVYDLNEQGFRIAEESFGLSDECNWGMVGYRVQKDEVAVRYSQTGIPSMDSNEFGMNAFTGSGLLVNGTNISSSSTINKFVHFYSMFVSPTYNMGENVILALDIINSYNYNISSLKINGISYTVLENTVSVPGEEVAGKKEYIIESIRIAGKEYDLDIKFDIDFKQNTAIEIENDGILNSIGFDRTEVEPLGQYILESNISISKEFIPIGIYIDSIYYEDIAFLESLNGFNITKAFNMENLTGTKTHNIQKIKFINSSSGYLDFSYLEINQNIDMKSTINITNHVSLLSVETDKQNYNFGDTIVVTLNLNNLNNTKATSVVINNVRYNLLDQLIYSKIEVMLNNVNISSENIFSLNIQSIEFSVEYNGNLYKTDLNTDYSQNVNFSSPIDLSETRLNQVVVQDEFRYDEAIIFKLFFSNPNGYDISAIEMDNSYNYKINRLSESEVEIHVDINAVGEIEILLETIVFSHTYNNTSYSRSLNVDRNISFNILNYDHSSEVIIGNVQLEKNYYENMDTVLKIEILENNINNTFGDLIINNKKYNYEIIDDVIHVNLGKINQGKANITIESIEVINSNNDTALKKLNFINELNIDSAENYILDNSTGISKLFFTITLVLFSPLWAIVGFAWFKYLMIGTAIVLAIIISVLEIKKAVKNKEDERYYLYGH